ncbi:MAG: hypothetical protein QM753_10770 [Thermomicrobiales bacterium]
MQTVSRRTFLRMTGGGVACVALAGRMPVAIAQDDPIPATGAGYYRGLDQMAGLTSVIARGFMHKDAGSYLFDAPEGMAAMLGGLDLTIASFESAADATAAMPAFSAIAEEHLATTLASMQEVASDRLAGLPVGTIARSLHFAEMEATLEFGMQMWVGAVIAPFDASLVYAHALGFGEPPVDAPMDIVIAAVKQTGEAPPGNDLPTWMVDGTSSGGDWDRLPGGGDPVLGDLAGNLLGSPMDTPLFPEFLY